MNEAIQYAETAASLRNSATPGGGYIGDIAQMHAQQQAAMRQHDERAKAEHTERQRACALEAAIRVTTASGAPDATNTLEAARAFLAFLQSE